MSERELLAEIKRVGDAQGEKYKPAVIVEPRKP